MIQLSSKIEVSGVLFPFCKELTITSSYDQLTDTAKIVVPKKIRYSTRDGSSVSNITKGEGALFNRGDLVDIDLGYDHKLNKRYIGYLSGIKTKFPLEFSCEDNMYFLKQSTVSISLKNPKLSELIDALNIPFFDVDVLTEQNLGDFRISNATPAQVLDELRRKHGVYSFFRDNTLFVGLAVVPKLQSTHRFTFFKDIINGDSLEFINDYDRKIKVVAKSIKDDNTEIQVTVGDSDGETRTLYFYNIEKESDLKKIAESRVDQLKYSGYNGSFKTFLTPFVQHGDIVELVNEEIPEQSGAYIVYKNVTTFGVSGGRQNITIKQKVYDLVKDNSGEWVKAN